MSIIEKMRDNNTHLYIYGAGKVGKNVLAWLREIDRLPVAFLVTKVEDNAASVEEFPVIGVEEYKNKESDFVVVAVGKRLIAEVEHILAERGISDYSYMDWKLFSCLRRHIYMDILRKSGKSYFEDASYTVSPGFLPLGCVKNNRIVHFRFPVNDRTPIRELRKFVLDHEFVSEFEAVYGFMYEWENRKSVKEASTAKILKACCHLDKETDMHVSNQYIVPIQVGKSLTDMQICNLTDNTGENISERNYNYSECTALYWAWKNRWEEGVDYIGLCHYRRQPDISEEQIRELKAQNVDMVLTAPTFVWNLPKEFSFWTKHAKDWEVMKQAITEYMPEYLEAFEIYEKQHFCCECNMFLMKRRLFDEYANYLFTILEYIEKYWDKNEPERKDRYLGYLAENLLSVFAIKNKNMLRIMYVDMLTWIDKDDYMDSLMVEKLTMQRNRNRELFQCTLRWLELHEDGTSLMPYFRLHNCKKIAIYGAGDLGQMLLKELRREEDIKVLYFLDRMAETNRKEWNVPVYFPQEYSALPDVDIVIVTVFSVFEEIQQELIKIRPDIVVISIDKIINITRNEVWYAQRQGNV